MPPSLPPCVPLATLIKPYIHRDTADALIVLQLSSLESEGREISARHGMPLAQFCDEPPGEIDDDDRDDRPDLHGRARHHTSRVCEGDSGEVGRSEVCTSRGYISWGKIRCIAGTTDRATM